MQRDQPSASYPALAISTKLRRDLESFFEADLSTVRIHADARSDWMNIAVGTLAFTVGEEIFIRRNLGNPNSVQFRFILAHELTHVLQKRRHREPNRLGIASITCQILEKEANAAASAFINECRRSLTLSPDHPARPRAFGPIGHFYTVYYVCLAAGIPDAEAARLSFYAQLPDELTEFDARDVLTQWYWRYLRYLAFRDRDGLDNWLALYASKRFMENPLDYVSIIQSGLPLFDRWFVGRTGDVALNDFSRKRYSSALHLRICAARIRRQLRAPNVGQYQLYVSTSSRALRHRLDEEGGAGKLSCEHSYTRFPWYELGNLRR